VEVINMQKAQDENALHMAGKLPADPMKGVRPANPRAAEEERKRVEVYTVKQLLESSHERALAPRAQGLTTGHYLLDRYTGGFRPGFVWAMGGETSWGKSSWAVSIADENLSQGKRVLIVSVEDEQEVYGDRLMCRRARVSADRLRNGRRFLLKDELERIAAVASRGEPAPVYLRAVGKPIDELTPTIDKLVKLEGIDLVVADYLQAFKPRPSKDRRQEVNYIARALTDCIKNAGASGLLLSQVTIDKKRNGPPGKYDLRESQDLANGAEVVVLGWTAEKDYFGDEDPGTDATGRQLQREVTFAKGLRYMLLAKNKTGPKDMFMDMSFDEHTACFDAVEDPETARYTKLHDDLGSSDWDR
jgi:replicative DNA helicase